MKSPFIIARGPWKWFLEHFGIAAIAMPWGSVYILEIYRNHIGLKRHELFHLRQMRRDGRLIFTLRYLYWLVLYGYWENPYEEEAYRIAPIIGD